MSTPHERIFAIVARVLDLEPERVDHRLTREDAETWDSFNHLLLISAIEKETGMKFTVPQIGRIKSVADILQIIDARTP